MLFPGYRPAGFDDVPITAIVTMETVGSGTRYVFTALHRDEADGSCRLCSPAARGDPTRVTLSRRATPVDQLIAFRE